MEDAQAAQSAQGRPVESVLREARLRHLHRSESVVVERKTAMREVIARLQETHTGSVLVVDPDGSLAGIFTERDYLDKVAVKDARERSHAPETPVERLMTASPRTLTPDHTLLDAIRLMTEGGYRHIPLVETNGKVFGLVSANDVVLYIAEHFPAEVYNLPPRLHQPIRTLDGG